VVQTAVHRQARALGSAAHLPPDAAMHRVTNFCSVSVSHLLGESL